MHELNSVPPRCPEDEEEERRRERGNKAHDDHKYNPSPSSKTKSRNTKSDSRIDISDDSFYEIDIHQKKSHESTNIASVRPRSPHPTDSSSPDKHHGKLKPALKSSLKHSSTDSVIQDPGFYYEKCNKKAVGFFSKIGVLAFIFIFYVVYMSMFIHLKCT